MKLKRICKGELKVEPLDINSRLDCCTLQKLLLGLREVGGLLCLVYLLHIHDVLRFDVLLPAAAVGKFIVRSLVIVFLDGVVVLEGVDDGAGGDVRPQLGASGAASYGERRQVRAQAHLGLDAWIQANLPWQLGAGANE